MALVLVAVGLAVSLVVMTGRAETSSEMTVREQGQGAPPWVEPASPTTTIPADEAAKRVAEREPGVAREVIDVGAEVEGEARAAWGASFAGVWRDESGQLHVATTSDDVGRLSVDGLVSHQVTYSLDELANFHAKLDEASPKLIEKGVRLGMWGVSPATNSIEVFVIASNDDLGLAADAVRVAVGDGPYSFQAVVEGAKPVSRLADYDPHSGAAKIYNAYGQCTSGIEWVLPTNPFTYYQTTSGHCADIWTLWLTTGGWYGGTGTTWNGLDQPGTGRIDAALIAPITSTQPYFYVGLPNSNGVVHHCCGDSTWQGTATGVRTSGAISGEVQQGTGAVLATNQTVAYWDGSINVGTVYHVNRAYCYAQVGDSGAPVFRVESGDIVVMGILAASWDADECLYTPIKPVITSTGGTVGS